MPAPSRVYSIQALMAEGFSKRTIYYYTHTRVLPPALGSGPTAHYTDQHISILRAIKERRDAAIRLDDLADHLAAQFPHAYARQPGNGRGVCEA